MYSLKIALNHALSFAHSYESLSYAIIISMILFPMNKGLDYEHKYFESFISYQNIVIINKMLV